jgi:ATP-dependent Clp protease ATP-binding subunit ClpB
MNRDKFTIKANQLIERSLQIAEEYGNQEIKPVHLAFAVLSDIENIVPETVKKIGVSIDIAIDKLKEDIQKLPKVSGADVYGGKEFRKVLDRALKTTDKFKDDYISRNIYFLRFWKITGNVLIH